jgi:hypothetical protein
MKQTVKKWLQGALFVPALALGVGFMAPLFSATPVSAQCTNDVSGGLAGGANCAKGDEQRDDLFGPSGIFKTITDVLLFIIGAISVIMLIIGGIRYTISNGDSAAVTSAKNTILYAVIGIVVAILAYALVSFVVGSFATPS